MSIFSDAGIDDSPTACRAMMAMRSGLRGLMSELFAIDELVEIDQDTGGGDECCRLDCLGGRRLLFNDAERFEGVSLAGLYASILFRTEGLKALQFFLAGRAIEGELEKASKLQGAIVRHFAHDSGGQRLGGLDEDGIVHHGEGL